MRRLLRAAVPKTDSLLAALPRPEIAGRIYAIGDVHGRADLLSRLLEKIYSEAEQAPPGTPLTLVMLGDYVDRGEDSKRVLEICRRLRLDAPVDEVVLLRGNHEAALLAFLKDPNYGEQWFSWGGVETVASYGVDAPWDRARARDYAGLRDEFRRALGGDAAMLAAQTTPSWRCGNIFFCHAAIDPDLALERQPESALLWGEPRFLQRGGPPGMVVVHGHTVTEQPDVGSNRIGIDTGAYLSGRLTALAIDAQGYRFLGS